MGLMDRAGELLLPIQYDHLVLDRDRLQGDKEGEPTPFHLRTRSIITE